VFSIFVGINEEKPKLEQDPLHFEAQLKGSAKPQHISCHVQSKQASHHKIGTVAHSTMWGGHPMPGTTVPPSYSTGDFLDSCTECKRGFQNFLRIKYCMSSFSFSLA